MKNSEDCNFCIRQLIYNGNSYTGKKTENRQNAKFLAIGGPQFVITTSCGVGSNDKVTIYRQTSYMSRTLVDNKITDHSGVVGAYSFLT